jgi:hypothetical protein
LLQVIGKFVELRKREVESTVEAGV